MLASVRRVSWLPSQFGTVGSTSRHAFLPTFAHYRLTPPSRLFTSSSSLGIEAMFTKAVQQANPASISKQQPLSHISFPSSSATSRSNVHSNSSQQKPFQSSRTSVFEVNNVLKPSASSALNGPSITRTNGTSHVLKRNVSQTVGCESSSGSFNSPHDSMHRDAFLESQSSHTISQSTLSASGKVESLHQAVYFDENDFDDDVDLDLEVEDPINKGRLSASKAAITLPLEGGTVLPKDMGAATSSAPLAWSSSPLQHKATPPNANLIRRAKDVNGSDESQSTTTTVPNELDSNPRSSKRRVLPWLADGDNEVVEEAGRGPPAHVQRISDRHRAGRAQPQQRNGEFTPLPKDDQHFQYSWNKTASAMKEEQKKLRQANKRLVKSNDASDENLKKSIRAKRRDALEKLFLSEEQQRILKLVVESGKSIFFTGSAGTGKSVLMREIISGLRKKYAKEPDRVAVTASTGLAACNVGGVTLHSFGGIGLGKEAVPELVKKIRRNQKAKNRWLRTKVLIVDEISMVDGDLFDKLEGIARAIRNNGRPFGGIQLIITGDFFQLPPVPDYGKIAKFAFDAATWDTSIEHTIGLTHIFRQKDPVFANMLNEMRLGKLSPQSINAFRSLSRPLTFTDDLHETELFPTRSEVDRANNLRMSNLAGNTKVFPAIDGGSIADLAQRTKLLANCMAPPTIELKKGAQVMLIKNIDETLVNGSQGTVMAFMDEKTFDIYHEDEEEFQAIETMDFDDENMSRARKKLKTMMNKDLVADTTQGKWPLVRFKMQDGTSRDLLCQPEVWKIELPNGEIQASRSQIPLILAWALSIHKAQGQTLNRVKVDLGKIFEKGQAYVALSRATCQEGLQILRFDPKKVMAHDRVRDFYDRLYSVERASKQPARDSASYNAQSAQVYERNLLQGGSSAGTAASNAAMDGCNFEEEEEELLMSAYS